MSTSIECQDKNQPLVSIVMPVYNGGDYLKEAIDSALAQTYNNIEIIIVNDGSDDGGITEKIALSYGERVRYFRKKNGGVATALNLGIRNMRGGYFTWLSHDDIYLTDKIQRQVELVCQSGSDMTIVYGNYHVLDMINGRSSIERKERSFPIEYLDKSIYPVMAGAVAGCTVFFHKKHFDRIGYFDEGLKTTQDYDFWFRLFRGQNIIFDPIPSMIVRYHKNQGSRVLPEHIKERDELHLKFLEEITKEEQKELWGGEFYFYTTMLLYFRLCGLEICCKIAEEKLRNMPVPEGLWEEFEKNREAVEELFGQKYKNLYVVGAGKIGCGVIQELKSKGIEIAQVLDNDSNKWGLDIEGIKCRGIDGGFDVSSGFIIATKYGIEELKDQLESYNYKNIIEWTVVRENLMRCKQVIPELIKERKS